MKFLTFIILITAFVTILQAANEPYIAYIYPAGGQQGTKFQVKVAGQRLRGITAITFTGTGISATLSDYTPANGKLNILQEEELRKRIEEIRKIRINEMKAGKKPVAIIPPAVTTAPVTTATPVAPNTPVTTPANPPVTTPEPVKVQLPDLPDLRNLDQMTIKELAVIVDKYLNRQKRPKAPMDEIAIIDVTIDATTAIGNHEMRLRSNQGGLTNPMIFQVGDIPEISEPGEYEPKPETPPVLNVPTIINGQIMPGEVDKYTVQMKAGQKLVISAQARNLIPYIADGVPGWIQGILAINDANGNELAFNDDNGFDPDPILYFNVPADGIYIIKFRDSIYRGRWDFVYRIYIAEQPVMQVLFPTGSRCGMSMSNYPADWGLPVKPPVTDLQFTDLPRLAETEPNNSIEKAQNITIPLVINGCISSDNDADYYKFTGKAGDTITAAISARRYGSQLDSFLQLLDANGKVISFNDDFECRDLGLLTQHADSYLTVKLPATGTFFLWVCDTQHHGGDLFTYSLRVSTPLPDFALFISPSCINVPPGRPAIISVSAIRKDGWDGDIEVVLKDAPAGFVIDGGIIPRGKENIRITLKAPEKKMELPVNLIMEGRAVVGDKTITRPVVAVDKMMQAFAYTHLVPATNLEVLVAGGRKMPVITLVNKERLIIPSGGTAKTTINIQPPISPLIPVHIELSEPPTGIILKNAQNSPEGIVLTFAAIDKHPGTIDNLIAEVFIDVDVPDKKTGTTKKQRVSAGVFPAIPIEVTKPETK